MKYNDLEWGELHLNKVLLHGEGFVVLTLCIFFYKYGQFSWTLFFILLLSPDISIVGYLFNKKMGAIIYNIFHTYIITIGIIILGLIFSNQTIIAIGIIWSAHIGMDRMVGFGLKYPTKFNDTHLSKV